MDDAVVFVDGADECFLHRDEQFAAGGCFYYKEYVDGAVVYGYYFAQWAMCNVVYGVAYEVVVGGLFLFVFDIVSLGVVDFEVYKGACIVVAVDVNEFYQSRSVGLEAVLFDKEGYEDVVDAAYDIGRVGAVENVVGKGEREFSPHAMRLVELAYFYEFFSTYHGHRGVTVG